ncbi:MAG: amidohydrolase family protein [bacterium]
MADPSVDLLIDNARFVLTQNAGRNLLEGASIAIRGDTIAAVGPASEIREKFSAGRTIDASDRFVTPGLINAHTHMESCYDKGLLDDVPAVPYCERKFSFTWGSLTAENYYYAALHTMLCCLKTGTTTIADCGTIPTMEGSVVRAVRDIGIRGVLARELMDVHTATKSSYASYDAFTQLCDRLQENTQECMENSEAFIREHHMQADGRVRAALDIQQVCNCSPDLCRGVKELAERFDFGIQSHVAVTHDMVEMTRKRYGMRDVEYLNHVGVLGPRIICAHMCWLDAGELILMKETGAHVAHIPGASLHGIYSSVHHRSKIPELVNLGVNVVLGNDESNTGTCHDMVREMYLVAGCHAEARGTHVFPDENLFQIRSGATKATVLDMATLNGAKGLLLEKEVGSIEAGKKADLVLWDLTSYEWVPTTRHNLISNFIFNATGRSARTVIVNGVPVIEDHRLTTLDEEEILHRVQEFGEQIIPTAPWLAHPETWELKWVKE